MNQTDDSNVPIDLKDKFEKYAEDLLNRLFRIVNSWTHDPDLTNDVVQEAACRFLSRMQARDWSQPIDNFDAFLTTIARNCLTDLRRKQGKKRFLSLDDDPDEKVNKAVHRALLFNEVFTGVDAEQLEELREEVPLRMILQGLSEDDRELIRLHKVEELSPKKIAEIRGEDVYRLRYRLNNIYATIRYRARKYLQTSGKKSLF